MKRSIIEIGIVFLNTFFLTMSGGALVILLGLSSIVKNIGMLIAFSYSIGISVFWLLIRYFEIVTKKYNVSLALTYLAMTVLIGLMLIHITHKCSAIWSAVDGLDILFYVWIAVFVFLIYSIDTSSVFSRWSFANKVMMCVGSGHVYRHTNAAIFIVKNNRIPILGQCIGQSLLESVYVSVGLKKGALHIFVHMVISHIMTFLFLFDLCRLLGLPMWSGVILILLVVFGSMNLDCEIHSGSGGSGEPWFNTYIDTQNAIILCGIIVLSICSSEVLLSYCLVLIAIGALVFNYTAPQYLLYLGAYICLDFVFRTIFGDDLFGIVLCFCVYGFCAVVSMFVGGMFTPKRFRERNKSIHGMVEIYGRLFFGGGFYCDIKGCGETMTKNPLMIARCLGIDLLETLICAFFSFYVNNDSLAYLVRIIVVIHIATLIGVSCVTVWGMVDEFHRLFCSTVLFIKVAFVLSVFSCICSFDIEIRAISWTIVSLLVLYSVRERIVELIRYVCSGCAKKKLSRMFYALSFNVRYIEKSTHGDDWFDAKQREVAIRPDQCVSIGHLRNLKRQGKCVYIYGAGSKKLYNLLNEYYKIKCDGFIDRNARNIDFGDVPVFTFDDFIQEKGIDGCEVIIATASIWYNEIIRNLENAGIKDYKLYHNKMIMMR